jgi:hypothetical protein
VLFGRRHLFLGLALCAVLHVLSVRTHRITPAISKVSVVAEGSFQTNGQHPGEPFTHATGVRSWGSWSGSDENVGTLTIGPFAASRMLRFGAGGYPGKEGNTLRVELVGNPDFRELKPADIGERWRVIDVELPRDWVGRSIRLVATDQSKILGGWLGVTEPIRGGRSDGNNALIQSLASWSIHGFLLVLLFSASFHLIVARTSLASHWAPLASAAVVAAVGYVAFWAYFVHAFVGVIFSWTILGVVTAITLSPQWWSPMSASGSATADGKPNQPDGDSGLHRSERRSEIRIVLGLMAAVGFFHLALLHLFPTQHDFYTLAANRYREAMPSDNVLPHTTAERLFASESLKNPIDEWLSSDRPPLQAGWLLTTWPVSKALGLDRRTASGTSAVWFQLLWVAAAYGLLRSFAVERVRAAGWVAAFALCGFFLQNTVYTWPKLSAGAFACGTFGLLILSGKGAGWRTNATWAAIFAALAWLSHGGVAFSLLALLPFVARPILRHWRQAVPGAIILLVLVTPWMAYQKWYDPPANRLFKWHLAGQAERDSRGTWETIRDSYAKAGWREAWENKVTNLHTQVFGDWRDLFDFSAPHAAERRRIEFFHSGRALTWWPLAALLLAVISRRRWFTPGRELAILGAWLAVTVVIWCLLLFGKYQAVIHHGSYAVMIGAFVLCAVIIERAGPRWFGVVAILQALTLGTTWATGNSLVHGPMSGLWFVIGAGIILAWWLVRAIRTKPPAAPPVALDERQHVRESPPAAGSSSTIAAFRAWWQNPRLTFWVLAGLALLLFLRKPHQLHTPQLWAEDGSIFLVQADLHGASAITMPYMGYLHTLPRLIAWTAPKLLDPAWWPHFYNGISFVIWLAVLARLFTSRFDLPGKPWLALAFAIVPHSGEVFFNVTNLQWLTAFVLIQQAMIAAPRNSAERIGDRLILAFVTLTGPFGIAFLPLIVWRWWRDRSRDNAWLVIIVVLGAAIQAWFVIRTGPRFEFQSEPLQLGPTFVVLARRLVAWPLFGRDLALGLSTVTVGWLGVVMLVLLPAWALRPHRHRLLRAQIVAALALITAAAVYRTRPDTWAADNLDFGDRYFYIPRVLLAWLLIWEFNATPRVVAILARVSGLIVLLVQLRTYSVVAPTNYHWADHVDPIRRGVPADIPTLPERWTLHYEGRPAHRP